MPGMKMRREDSIKIQRNFEYILNNLVNCDGLVDYLFSREVLDYEQQIMIEETKTGKPRVKKLLNLLMTECGDCYDDFLEALREKKLEEMANLIDSAKVEKGAMQEDHLDIWSSQQEFLVTKFKNDVEDLITKFYRQMIIDSHEIRDNYNVAGATRLVEIPGERGEHVLPRIIKAKVEKGLMQEDHLDIWNSEHDFLVTEFKNHLEELMLKFSSQMIIDSDDKEKIRRGMQANYNVGGAICLVEILAERGEHVLPRIIKALKPTYNNVANRLEDRLAELKLEILNNERFPIQEQVEYE